MMKSLYITFAFLLPILTSPNAFSQSDSTEPCTAYELCTVCGGICPGHARIDVQALLDSIQPSGEIADYYRNNNAAFNAPLIYSGYINTTPPRFVLPAPVFEMRASSTAADSLKYVGILTRELISPDELEEGDEVLELTREDLGLDPDSVPVPFDNSSFLAGSLPEWLRVSLRAERIQRDLRYNYMISHPDRILYALWDIPAPPTLPEDDYSLEAFFKSMDLPEIEVEDAILPEFEVRKRYWLHKFGTGLQFSQAYVSSNWYQGGSNYLALLFNFNWNVNLNTVFKPNLLFDSSLSYKLAINSNPKSSLHKYSISQDQFQYNLKAGFKAFRKWFYSLSLQFKTQFFNAYPQDSPDLTASFLSPADLNIGLGMTYNTSAFNDNLKLSVSIAPISYNLKVCASDRIDHTQFNIDPLRHTHSEIGSNAEATLTWQILPNLSWKSRMFLFSDYHYFQADWENTFNFSFNKFLSTQLYVYPRFDSSSDFNSSRWHYWMLKEILSVGFSYEFGTI